MGDASLCPEIVLKRAPKVAFAPTVVVYGDLGICDMAPSARCRCGIRRSPIRGGAPWPLLVVERVVQGTIMPRSSTRIGCAARQYFLSRRTDALAARSPWRRTMPMHKGGSSSRSQLSVITE